MEKWSRRRGGLDHPLSPSNPLLSHFITLSSTMIGIGPNEKGDQICSFQYKSIDYYGLILYRLDSINTI